MANELALPASFGAPPAVFKGAPTTNDELGAGVAASYGVIGYRGKVWSIKFQGQETPLMREDGDGPRNSIEVIIVKASPAISKIYYKSGYVDGSNAAPDCWSGNGITPDAGVKEKVSPTCATCPMNAWGSRTTDAGKQAKACADSRRIAVVPMNDIDNELTGGPMLLRIPAASLKDLKAYGDLLSSYQYPYYAAATRVSFDAAEAFPKFVFAAIRPLVEAEANKILALREDVRVSQVLAERLEAASLAGAAAEAAKVVPASPFEQPPVTAAGNTPAAAAQAAPQQAKPAAVAPKPKAAAKPATAAPVAKPPTPQEIAAKMLAEAQEQAAKILADAAAAVAATTAAPKSAVEKLLAEGASEEAEEVEAVEEVVDETAGEMPAGFDALLEKIL
jgi:hypothetical protein